MKITIELDDAVYARARQLSNESSRTIEELIEDGLHLLFELHAKRAQNEPFRLHTVGNGLQPGVLLTSNEVVADLMEWLEGD